MVLGHTFRPNLCQDGSAQYLDDLHTSLSSAAWISHGGYLNYGAPARGSRMSSRAGAVPSALGPSALLGPSACSTPRKRRDSPSSATQLQPSRASTRSALDPR